MLAKDPSQRPSAQDCLQHSWLNPGAHPISLSKPYTVQCKFSSLYSHEDDLHGVDEMKFLLRMQSKEKISILGSDQKAMTNENSGKSAITS